MFASLVSSPVSDVREGRPVPTTGWAGERQEREPHLALRPFWVAVGAVAVLGMLLFRADSRGTPASSQASESTSISGTRAFGEAVDPEPIGVQLAMVEVTTRGFVVPRSSVAFVEGKPMVFVAEPGLRLFVATPVQLGERAGDAQGIAAGLREGERVVMGDLSALERGLR